MVKIDFKHGLPDGCIEWLWQNVGNGNYDIERKQFTDFSHFDWFYERKWTNVKNEYYYVAKVWVNDDDLALLFKLRWS